MNHTRMLYGMLCVFGMFMPMIGFLIGNIRYKRHKDKIKEALHTEYKKAQERGGMASLFYKHEGKRLFYRTFGTPVLIFLY